MATHKQRIDKLLRQYAPLVGGVDTDGRQHYLTESQQRQQLFWIKNRIQDHVAGYFCLGDMIRDKIREDMYDIEYLGPVKDANTPKLKATIANKKAEQARDIAVGRRLKRERMGLFETSPGADDEPDDLG